MSPFLNEDVTVVDNLEEVVAELYPKRTDRQHATACKVIRERVAQGLPPLITPEQRRRIAEIISAPNGGI